MIAGLAAHTSLQTMQETFWQGMDASETPRGGSSPSGTGGGSIPSNLHARNGLIGSNFL